MASLLVYPRLAVGNHDRRKKKGLRAHANHGSSWRARGNPMGNRGETKPVPEQGGDAVEADTRGLLRT